MKGIEQFDVSIETKVRDASLIDLATTQLEGLLQMALVDMCAGGAEIETSLSTYSVTSEVKGERPRVEREIRIKVTAKVVDW